MHLVFLNQYFPPDAAPTGTMLRDAAVAAVAAGHQVTVLCASGGYAAAVDAAGTHRGSPSEPPDGIRVIRIGATRFGRTSKLAKLTDYFTYSVGLCWHLLRLRPRPDRVIALTTPPYLCLLARVFSKFRGADHAGWEMDLYPDVMIAHGMLRRGSFPANLLAFLSRLGHGGKRMRVALTLGPDMAAALAAYADPARIEWIPLWGPPAAPNRNPVGLRASRGWESDDLILMYSGNMGLGHRFGEILSIATATPSTAHRRFVFFGGGSRHREIASAIAEHPDAPLELHPYADAADLANHLASADIHLVSLEPKWTGTMVPSKLQGIFAVGRPVIFVGDRESSIGQWITESGGGIVVPPGDIAALASALEHFSVSANRACAGKAASEYARTHFSRAENPAAVIRALVANPSAR